MFLPKKYFLVAFLLPLIIASCKNGEPASAENQEPVRTPVTITHIDQSPLAEYIELNATSGFLLKNYVKANANGYLQSADISPGQAVNRGQILFTVKTKEAQSIGNAINVLDSSFKFNGTNVIRAGAKGYITQLNHQAGDYVQDGEQLAVISDVNSFVFLMDLPFELRPYAPVGKPVEVLLPDGTRLPGRISSAMPTVDAVSQTQNMVIKLHTPRPVPENLIGKVRIAKTIREHTTSLPKAAVLTNETQSEFWIMKMTDSTTAVKVPVKKGIETSDRVEILSPSLTANDKILLSGNYGLPDTAKVIITQP